jgi:uncharacterized membrane protein
MENERQLKYTRTLARLLANESSELSKLYNKRIIFYWLGMLMVVGSILASIKPIYPTWLLTVIGVIGGYILCFAINIRHMLTIWPTLKSHLNKNEIINATKDNNA